MLPQQDRERFERLMLEALAIDPDENPSRRLQNLIAQKRARYLLDHVEDYFLE
jgi:predicted anti-sigma-YlaC factor YlaD